MQEKIIFFRKGHVNGRKSREVFKYLKKELPGDVRWNFAKFLVDHEGKPIKRYSPQTEPLDIREDIEELLKKRGLKLEEPEILEV